MAFSLPTPGSDAREAMGDIAHIVELLNPANLSRLPTLRGGLAQAKRTLKGAPAGSRVNVVVIRNDDSRHLISVGARGGWRTVWDFGKGR